MILGSDVKPQPAQFIEPALIRVAIDTGILSVFKEEEHHGPDFEISEISTRTGIDPALTGTICKL